MSSSSLPPSSTPPPPPPSNAKYIVLGLVLLAGSAGLYFMSGSSEPPAVPTPPVIPNAVQRQTALGQDEFEIPAEDAAVTEQVASAEPTKRRPAGGGGNWDSCTGDIPGAAAAMAQYNTQIRNCYERALKSNGLLQGSLNLRLRVGANGAVDATQVTGSLGDREVFSCVRTVADRIRFPQVRGGSCAVIAVPFSFTPRS